MSSSVKPIDPSSLLQRCHRSKRRWLVTQWSFVVLLAASIAIGMGSTLTRLKQPIQLADNQFLSESSYEQMIQRTLLSGKLGLTIGIVAFSGYLYAAIMHHRSRLKLQQVHNEEDILRKTGAPPEQGES